MSVAYIGIGSNLGDREFNCKQAISLLRQKGTTVSKESSLYETKPWGVRDQPLFLNMAIEIETDLKPFELLSTLKDIEKEMGREETFLWGPRIIDLDILLYDNNIVDEEGLRIPHPHMQDREFVLRPLCEIAGDVTHPLLLLSMGELLQRLKLTENL
ncbi:MAG: 2-amino-4-hydroxy-6-hydroxymethyldihydropteridine diphosphokinase [Thermodesulfovibrionales bacterium]|jgi:2-amino-4-hydroxy-6-hydroxymethyldihydropteridine diphosphokinase